MAFHDTQYIDLVNDVLTNGYVKTDRTGTGTISVFDRTMRFDLRDGTIPLLTTKKMGLNAIIHELLWYLTGNTNIKYLTENNVKIWNEWADAQGDLGPVYGYQWRKWPKYQIEEFDCPTDGLYEVEFSYVDQIAELINGLKNIQIAVD